MDGLAGVGEVCAWAPNGEHVWKRSLSTYVKHQYCGLCGLVRQIKGGRHPRPPCPHHPSGKHAWGRSKGNGPYRCARCGIPQRSEKNETWKRRVEACFDRDGARCFYCGKELILETVTLDHFIPRSKGGSDGIPNRRAACDLCDRAKGDQMPWEFMPERFLAPEDDDG